MSQLGDPVEQAKELARSQRETDIRKEALSQAIKWAELRGGGDLEGAEFYEEKKRKALLDVAEAFRKFLAGK